VAQLSKHALIKQVILALFLMAGLAVASFPAWAEFDPGLTQQLAPSADSNVENSIGANLSAEDDSGDTADWKFIYNQTGDPTHVKVQVTAPGADGSDETYNTTLDSSEVDQLIQWLTQVQHQIATQNSR
jgi:hypothetical protein